MAGDSGSHPAPGAGRAVSPPVFTYWGERAPLSPAASEPMVAPPFLPESEDELDAAYPSVDATLVVDDGERAAALPEFEADPVEELGFAPLGDFTALDSDEGVSFDFAPEPVDDAIPADAFLFPGEEDAGAAAYDEGPGATAAYGEESREPLPTSSNNPVHALADRLEQLARHLRADGVSALAAGAVAGDRFDALLAGLLTGYLAAQSDRA